MLVLSESRLALRRFLVTSSQVLICVKQIKIVNSLKCFSLEKLKLLRTCIRGGMRTYLLRRLILFWN